MRDVELQQQLPGVVFRWTVGRVELSVEGERVELRAQHVPDERWPGPECGETGATRPPKSIGDKRPAATLLRGASELRGPRDRQRRIQQFVAFLRHGVGGDRAHVTVPANPVG